MKWIKQTERLPEPNVNKFIKMDSIMGIGFYNDKNTFLSYKVHDTGWYYTTGISIPNDQIKNLEWLDEEKPNTSSQTLTQEQEDKYYPGIQYQRLFNAISETKGIPTQSDMDEIIRIVHEDFPLERLIQQ